MGLEGLLGRGKKAPIKDTSGAAAFEPVRVLVGEPFELKFGTKLKVSALCGNKLDQARLLPVGEIVLGDNVLVTRISTPGKGDTYLLQPDKDTEFDRKKDSAWAVERREAARVFVRGYSVLDRAAASTDAELLELHFEVVESTPSAS
jgi:hypothetical protein